MKLMRHSRNEEFLATQNTESAKGRGLPAGSASGGYGRTIEEGLCEANRSVRGSGCAAPALLGEGKEASEQGCSRQLALLWTPV